MDSYEVNMQKPMDGITPMRLLGLYAEHPSQELRKEILDRWWEDREVFANRIEEAIVLMSQNPRAGVVRTDGKVIDQWDKAFARYPQLWPELEREIRQITNATRTSVDQRRYCRVVLATMSRWRSLRPLQE